MEHGREKGTVVVVGAGLGGLSAAACLGAKGFRVDVYEKNARIGGKLNLLEAEEAQFDLGPSIIILPHLYERVFAQAGRKLSDYVRLARLEPQWRTFFEDGTVLDLHGDMAKMEAELSMLGPAATGYWSFMDYSRRLWAFAEKAYLDAGADTAWDILRGRRPGEILRNTDPFHSMDGSVRRFIGEPHLRQMLDFFIKYVGSSPYDAPALLNLLPYSQLGWGLWYVEGGLYNLARAFDRLLQDLGVRVHLNAEVTRILRDGRRVTGVELADGVRVEAGTVVSNMEVIPCLRRLLGRDDARTGRLERTFEPACSGLVVHVLLDRDYPCLAHHNFFFARDPQRHFNTIHRRKQLPDDPTIYLVCPTRTDRTLAPEGRHILKILPHVPYLQEPRFRPADYTELKQRLYEKLERMGLDDLRRHIIFEHVLTPDDIERMYYSNRGSIYGVVSHRWKNFGLKCPKHIAEFENLYFVGGSVNPGGGTPMVVLCGQMVADLIARRASGGGR